MANSIAAILFAASAALQYNDPDPLGWVAIYVAAAAACVQHRRHRLDAVAPVLVGLAAAVWAGLLAVGSADLFSFADVFRSMDDPEAGAELAREDIGLILVAFWMLVLAITARQWRPAPRDA